LRREVARAERFIRLVGDGPVVDLEPARFDLTACLAGATYRPACTNALRTPDALVEPGRATSMLGNVSANGPLFEVRRAVSAACSAARAYMNERGRLGGEDLLRLVEVLTLSARRDARSRRAAAR